MLSNRTDGEGAAVKELMKYGFCCWQFSAIRHCNSIKEEAKYEKKIVGDDIGSYNDS